MSKIIEAKKVVFDFLKESLASHEITIIKLEKLVDSWSAVAEVYENDSFLKSMNLPPKKTRVFYTVQLDTGLEVIGFERMDGNDV